MKHADLGITCICKYDELFFSFFKEPRAPYDLLQTNFSSSFYCKDSLLYAYMYIQLKVSTGEETTLPKAQKLRTKSSRILPKANGYQRPKLLQKFCNSDGQQLAKGWTVEVIEKAVSCREREKMDEGSKWTLQSFTIQYIPTVWRTKSDVALDVFAFISFFFFFFLYAFIYEFFNYSL